MSSRYQRWARIAVVVVTIVITQAVVCGVAALPSVSIAWLVWLAPLPAWAAIALSALLLVPLYILFALGMLVASPIANRLTGAYTPDGLRTRISDFDWPLLRWARYMAAGHLVNIIAGGLFHGSPVWTWYLRMNGARVGRRVFLNSAALSDHNLLAFGDDVVVGADVHLSGHTVERGMLLTGRVLVGANVTIGVGATVSIDTVIADGCQVGAHSYVPKHQSLEREAVYAGIPVHRISRGPETIERQPAAT